MRALVILGKIAGYIIMPVASTGQKQTNNPKTHTFLSFSNYDQHFVDIACHSLSMETLKITIIKAAYLHHHSAELPA